MLRKKLTKEKAKEIWEQIKLEQMENLGYDEDDLEDDSIEDEVNRETDECFIDHYGEDNLELTYEI